MINVNSQPISERSPRLHITDRALCSSGIPCSVSPELLLINVQKLIFIYIVHLRSVS